MKKYLIGIWVMMLSLLAACSGKHEEELKELFVVTPTSFDVDATGGQCTVNVQSGDSWSVMTEEKWLHTDVSKGMGHKSVHLTVDTNIMTERRSGTVILTEEESNVSVKVMVTQAGMSYTLSVDTTPVNVSAAGIESQHIDIQSNDDWHVTASEEWVTLSNDSGTGDGGFDIAVAPNDTHAERTATLTIEGLKGHQTESIDIIQSGMDYHLGVDVDALSVPAAGKVETITIDTDDEWSATTQDEWITLSPKDNTLEVNVAANVDPEDREGKIVITGKNSGIEQTVTVQQVGKQYDLAIDRDVPITSGAEGRSKTINVTTEDDWNVRSSEDWVTFSTTEGSGNGSFDVIIAPNISSSERTAVVTVAGVRSGIELTIDIEQSGKDYYLTVDRTYPVNSNAEGRSKTINITSNDDWMLSTSDEWLTLSRTEGSGNGSFDFYVAANSDTNPRAGKVIIEGKNSGIERIVEVTQEAFVHNLTISVTSISAPTEGKTQSVNVTSTDSWTVTASDSWITLSATSGSKNGSFTVTVEPNASTSARSGSVTVKGTASGITRTITVSQNAFVHTLTVNPTSISANNDGKTQSVSVSSTDSWTVSTADSWISLSATSGSKDGSFTVTVAPNTSTSARSGNVTVKGTASGITRTITVSQSAYVHTLTVNPTSISASTEGKTQSVNVSSTDSWTVSTADSWISLSSTSGSKDGSFTVTVAANSGDARSGSVTVKGTASGITRTISVSQTGKSYSLEVSPNHFSAKPEGASQSVTVTSNDAWTVSSSAAWATVSATSGSNNGSFTINVAANSDAADRSCTVTVKGKNSGISRTIAVSQTGTEGGVVGGTIEDIEWGN